VKYYQVTMNPEVELKGAKKFWLRVIRENDSIVVGWELDKEGERTHKQHVISRELAMFHPAKMNRTYGTMELIK